MTRPRNASGTRSCRVVMEEIKKIELQRHTSPAQFCYCPLTASVGCPGNDRARFGPDQKEDDMGEEALAGRASRTMGSVPLALALIVSTATAVHAELSSSAPRRVDKEHLLFYDGEQLAKKSEFILAAQLPARITKIDGFAVSPKIKFNHLLPGEHVVDVQYLKQMSLGSSSGSGNVSAISQEFALVRIKFDAKAGKAGVVKHRTGENQGFWAWIEEAKANTWTGTLMLVPKGGALPATILTGE